MTIVEALVRSFDNPDETRELTHGRFEIVRIGGMAIGRATYEPGWKWSEHVGRTLGSTRCTVEHVGLVLEGAAVAAMDDGRIIDLKAGTLFYVPGEPHDSWVIGNQRYVSLHFLNAEEYAT
jgi:mannose-6-phosphate isomerase-like protein (cupin superfamily)